MRLIDADELIKNLKAYYPFDAIHGITFATGFNQILTDIMNEATVDPVKHGRWRLLEDGDNVFECSCCKDAFILLEGTPTGNNYFYCPNCGAKKDEVSE